MRKFILFVGMVLIALISCDSANNSDKKLLKEVDKTLDFSVEQAMRLAKSLEDKPNQLPRTFQDGELKTSGSEWWTSGFFPGTLWYLYEYSHKPEVKAEAERFTELVRKEQTNTWTHDIGFMIYCSFGNGYRITGNEDYLEVINEASKSLITRFNPVTNTILSWSWSKKWQYPVIIDNMMNLEMLMWASKKFNNPEFARVATIHANTTMKEHFRDDYSSFHVISYDTITGVPEFKHTHQGYAHESAWARGQAWGLYGYTLMYRDSGDEAYLNQAVNIADFILNHPNLPEDKIPYWDFNAPDIPDALRDVSSGAIICSALLELSQYTDKNKSKEYFDVARKQLEVLCSPKYLANAGENGNFILKHSVGHLPGNSEVDVPLTYADYYFVEAMLRYKTLLNNKKLH